VGKSFALNHFVDTSFAGSAMRTTEGVWMSVNPTDDALIVAMDFEGAKSSIAGSGQYLFPRQESTALNDLLKKTLYSSSSTLRSPIW
jgi:hypothetical protein